MKRGLAVAPGGYELVVHQVGRDQHGAVARREGEGALALADVEPDTVEGNALPIAPDVALHDGLAQRFLGADAAGDDRVRAIRADDEAGTLDLPLAASARGNDARDPAVVLDQIDHVSVIAKRGSGGHGGLREHAIEQSTPRGAGVVVAVHRRWGALQHDAVQIHPPAGEGCGARGNLRQDAPIAQMSDAQRMNQVRRLPHVAGESVAVEKQHAVALAGQKHGRGRAGAAGADDDRVVDGCLPGRQPRSIGVTQPMKAPALSLTTAKRPVSGTSKAGRQTSPPAASTPSSRASISSTVM